ncbi:MAG: putative Flagellar motor switch protein [Microvirga sp.]|nr:putative Flagellar motor switch protein [Microvirga sp.]
MTHMIEALELEELDGRAAEGTAPLLSRDLGLVSHVMVELSVEVGTAELSIERLFDLKKGDVVKLKQAVNTPLTLRLNGKAIARGDLVAVDDNFGIHITELL